MGRSQNLTIMFTDIVGFTELTNRMSREALRQLLREHDRILLPTCRAFGGRRVKAIGDALLMTFQSPTDAVRCAMAMQNALALKRRQHAGLQHLHVRVAINVGEVRVESNDVFGEAVNVASRLEALTPSDAIWFTEAVYLAMNKAEVPSHPRGTRELRGIPEPVRVYSVPAHRVHRLVAAGEGGPKTEDLPYPHVAVSLRPLDATRVAMDHGMDLLRARLAPAWAAFVAGAVRTSTPVRWAVVTLACIGIVLALTLSVPTEQVDAALDPASPPSTQLLREGEALLTRRDTEGLAQLVAQRLLADPRDAEALLLQGHLAFARKRPLNGVGDYSRALTLDRSLQNNVRMAQNLVAMLDTEPGVVRPIALLYPGEALLQALAQRTGQPGYTGRVQAVLLLRELGQAARVDRFNYAVQELEGRSDCEDRLAAVRELRTLKDPRAIPHLEKALTGGVEGWFRQICLRDEAKATLDELRARAARGKS